MDYNNVIFDGDKVIIKGVKNFNSKHIFECGQCFRWNKSERGYIGVAFKKVIEVVQEGNDVLLLNSSLDDFYKIWEDYFDLKRDYTLIKDTLSVDPILKESVEFGSGIRILNQEPFETLMSFIISANNQIPRIKSIIERLSLNYGDKVTYENRDYYTFPTPEQLSVASIEDLRNLGLGFRDKYIYNTVKAVLEGSFAFLKKNNNEILDEDEIKHLDYHLETIVNMSHDSCHKSLLKYSGVGPKVADCIMLFSMKKQEAFPVDVWVKKAMMHFYNAPDGNLLKIRKFGQETFGDLAGFAQQYLFYNARENKIKID